MHLTDSSSPSTLRHFEGLIPKKPQKFNLPRHSSMMKMEVPNSHRKKPKLSRQSAVSLDYGLTLLGLNKKGRKSASFLFSIIKQSKLGSLELVGPISELDPVAQGLSNNKKP